MKRTRDARTIVLAVIIAAVAIAIPGVVLAGVIGNDASSRPVLDTYANFSIVDTNHAATQAGRVTQIDYYAGATLPMAFFVVSGSGPYTVKYVSSTFTPPATGANTFAVPASWWVAAGDNIGIYVEQTGVIPFEWVGAPASYTPAVNGKPVPTQVLSIEGTSNRTYSFVATVLSPTTSCSGPSATYTGWKDPSTVFVPANLTTPTSGPLFVDGIAYRVEGAGVFDAVGDGSILADAEYSQDTTQSTWTKYVNGYEPALGSEAINYLIDLRINGQPIDWGAYSSDHVYTHDLVGTGVPASFAFDVFDTYPSNNVGGLCASVFKDGTAPVVSNVAVTPGLVKVSKPVTVTAKIDDTTTLGSDIAAATYRVDGGAPQPMTATDLAFDSATEMVQATFTPTAGIHEICVYGEDKAGNVSTTKVCTTVKVYDRSVEISGAIVGHDTATITSWTDKGEPDFALDGHIYAGGSNVWGSISVNYKLLGPKTCTFTADGSTAFNLYNTTPRRVDLRNMLNSCDGKRYTFQIMERGGTLPRGGFFISEMPGDYTISTNYEVQGPGPLPYDYYMPIDRGNAIFWSAA